MKNILFDLGGVLIDIDYDKTIRNFRTLGFPHFEQMFSQLTADQLFRKLETGNISPDDFYTVMLSIAGTGVTRDEIEEAWNSMLIRFRKKSIDHLKVLAGQYDLYLLSNTNEIHYKAFTSMLLEETGYPGLEPFFKKSYFSHRIGLRKPDADAYAFVIQDANIVAEETLFIDDTIKNIEAARLMGFQTKLLNPEERIEKMLF